MRRASRIDANQQEIVNELRKKGYSVQSLGAVGNGCPDIMASKAGKMVLAEIKTEKGRLNQMQKHWIECWQYPVIIAKSCEEIEAAFCENH